MGTTSTTLIMQNDKPLVNMYTQYDGDPSGHGKDLYNFLKNISLVNGLSGNESMGSHANGVNCLAAQIIAHFKDDVGEIYIVPLDNCYENYNYRVEYDCNDNFLAIQCISNGKINFQGDLESFGKFCNNN
jgi:hypothetical protein